MPWPLLAAILPFLGAAGAAVGEGVAAAAPAIAGAGAAAAEATAPLAASALAPVAAGGASLAPLSSSFPAAVQGGAQTLLGGGANPLLPGGLVQQAAQGSAANAAALTPMSSYANLAGPAPALTGSTPGLSLSDLLRGVNLARNFLPSGKKQQQGNASAPAAPGAVGFPNRGPAASPAIPAISTPPSIFKSPWAPFR